MAPTKILSLRSGRRPRLEGRTASPLLAILCAALLAPLLVGCGFEPLYGDRGEAMEAALSQIKVMPIPEHIGQLLQWQLEREFNPDGDAVPARYALYVLISIRNDFLAVEPNNVAPRGSISAAADLALTTLDGKTVLYRGKIQSIADYNIGTDPYSADIGKSGAEKRVVEDIGDQVELRVATYFHTRAAAQ
jgi:LPS-assembly lipoprotein